MLTPYRPPANVGNIHKISFHSAIFFTSPFIFWTTATLQARSNSITTLSLEFAGISWNIWCAIVALKFDNLETLQLRFTDVSRERSYSTYLLNFLSRHPTITCLTLSRALTPPPPPLDAAILPLLSKLTAHATCLLWLMGGPENSYPQLKSIEVTCEQLHRANPVDYQAFDKALKSLASNSHDRTIILSFFSRGGLKEWFQKHIDRGDASLLASLQNLKRLRLKFDPCDIFEGNPTDIFPHWLALFPRLEQVVFQDEWPAPVLSEVSGMEEFVTSVIRGSPALNSVALGTSVAALRGDGDLIHISRSLNDIQFAWRGF